MAETVKEDPEVRERRLGELSEVVDLYIRSREPLLTVASPVVDSARVLRLLKGLREEVRTAGEGVSFAGFGERKKIKWNRRENSTIFELALGLRYAENTTSLSSGMAVAVGEENVLDAGALARVPGFKVGRLGGSTDKINAVVYYQFELKGCRYEGLILDIRPNPATTVAQFVAFE